MNATVLFVDLAAKSVVVLFAAWLVSLIFRKSSAAVKHLIWLSAFCVLLAAPVLTFVMPARAIHLIQRTIPEPAVSEARISDSLPKEILSGIGSRPTAWPAHAGSPHRSNRQLTIGSVASTASLDWHEASSDRWVPNWTLIGSAAVALWLCGAAIVAFQSLYALVAVGRLRRRSLPLEGKGLDRGRLARQLGLTRRWELRVCAGPKVPAAMTWGFMNPVVIVPQESEGWSQERLEAVLLHELAHVRRFDSVSQLIAALACAVYWFNPSVWLCARAMRAEAEIAADDTVLLMGIKPSVYARELVRIAAELGTRRQPYSTIGVPVMKKSKIESRVQAILDPSTRRRRGITTVQVLTTAAIAGALLVPIGMLRASLVPIEPHPPTLTLRIGQSDQDKVQADGAQAKQQAERAAAAAQKAKVLAEKATQIALKAKKIAEHDRAQAEAQKGLAEAQRGLANAQKQAAEKANQAIGKLDRAAAEKAYRAALAAEKAAVKAQRLLRTKQYDELYKRLRSQQISQQVARAQLQAAMSQMKAQRTQLEETQRKLQDVLQAMQRAKGSQDSRALSEEHLQALYRQGVLSKEALASELAAIKVQGESKLIELQDLTKNLDKAHIIEIAQVRLEQAEAALAVAKQALADVEQRYQAGIIEKTEVDRASLSLRSAEGDVELYKVILDGLQKKK